MRGHWPRICALRVADRRRWEREVRAALEGGKTYAEAAEALECSVRKVVEWAAELGLGPGRGVRGGRPRKIDVMRRKA